MDTSIQNGGSPDVGIEMTLIAALLLPSLLSRMSDAWFYLFSGVVR